ncbi:hypothetical protein T11_7043 [Trichinella zimbabwensis]|uniref:Uncharacterized protein n=1 Tax=Trichinella zimbabwensis TaxID=268475 RepID=A0A0V1FFR7_9BILA|nr:hypothetical protein T11_7043 [Trichinella zimbabwensis]
MNFEIPSEEFISWRTILQNTALFYEFDKCVA